MEELFLGAAGAEGTKELEDTGVGLGVGRGTGVGWGVGAGGTVLLTGLMLIGKVAGKGVDLTVRDSLLTIEAVTPSVRKGAQCPLLSVDPLLHVQLSLASLTTKP